MSPPASSTLKSPASFSRPLRKPSTQLCGKLPWQGERKKHRLRLPAHGSDVTESARQAAVPHALGRVPCPFEMDVLQAEISRNQGLMTARDGNHSTVVPDAYATEAGMPLCNLHAKPADQRSLGQGHSRNHIHTVQGGL